MRKAFLGVLVGALAASPVVVPVVAVAAPATDTDIVAGRSGDTSAKYDRAAHLQKLLDAEHAAGMIGVLARVRDSRWSWSGAAGVARLDDGAPMRPRLRHRVGSITKSFVATAVLQLVGERRVRLDEPIATYLPNALPTELGAKITVRHLLQHTSGLGNYTSALLTGPEAIEKAQITTYRPAELMAMGLTLPATNEPGAAWSYSNTNYILLGMLLERVTGRSVATEVRRRVLWPLRMRDTYFPGTQPRIRGPHGGAYVPWTDDKPRDFVNFNMSWAGAAGELVSTAKDLDRFYAALLGGQLLRPAQLTEMLRTVPFDPARPELGGYGLGVFNTNLPCGSFWGHNGGVIGHTTVSLHSPDGRRGVTLGENLNFYGEGDEHPIDVARAKFITTALCGSEAPTGAARSLGEALRATADGSPSAHR
ncbi:serine hydrolase domain-containing protein [Pilimelia columellifera]|uniref:Serine hydrolase domain-containing protein n=1 Tax=Pilimelia columellifera subsp. columellifera TaxID=706583 RepID=A0ABP6AQ46_9ACTN